MQGLILLNKPEGLTSFGAVARIKRLSHQKRVGHTGTLDPMATGVLPVLLGRATALCSLMLDSDKRYKATVKLGVATDTEDITGNVLTESEVNVTSAQLLNALERFKGKIMQRPPMFSALKKDGVRLYKLAREGKNIDIPEREIEIFSLEVLTPINENDEFQIDVHVSKGTYIRSLARDIGECLGCGACLTALERTNTSGFSLDNCVSLDSLSEENILENILSEELAVGYLPELQVTKNQAIRFSNGGQLGFERLKKAEYKDGEMFRVKCGDLFLGVGYADCKKEQIAVRCVINYPEREVAE